MKAVASRGFRGLVAHASLVTAAFLLACFYVWTASGGWPFELGEPHDGHYNLLARALVQGQLYLTVEPRPELLEMSEPYEPGRNGPYRLHDASLYHGRYYLYFGVVPALLLFVPWKLAGLGDLPQNLAAALFAWGGFLFSALLLRRLQHVYLGPRPRWMEWLATLTLGLANVAPFILRAPFVYEVAIAGGYFFLSGSAWLFASAGAGGRLRVARLSLGGLFLGLAIGCRPNLLVAVPLLPLLAWPALREHRDKWARAALAVLGPLGLCLLLLGTYNALRFGSPLEFGARYQLAGMRPVAWLDPRAIPPTLFFDFLAPPAARLEFPFLFPDRDYPGTTPAGYFKDTSTTGAIAHSPFLLLLVAAPFLLRRATLAAQAPLRDAIAVLTAVGLLIPLATSYAFASGAMRFQVDFVSFLAVPALLLWFLASGLEDGRLRRAFRMGGLLAIVWSCVVNLCLSLTGASDGLRRDNPALFRSLEARFEPLRISLGRVLVRDGRTVVRLRAAFPERLAAEAEPLLSSGTVTASDVLWVRQEGPGSFTFSLETAHGETHAAAPRSLEPGRFYGAEVDLDRVARQVVVTLDGGEVARFPARLGPVRADTVWLGRGPRGKGATDLGRFSGSLVSQAMIWAGPPGLTTLPPISSAPAIHTEPADDRPSSAVAGQLWVPAFRDGAFLFVGPGWRWIPRHFVDRVQVRRVVEFADLPPGTVEPILVSGDESSADGVYARHLGQGRVAFGLAHWRAGWNLGTSGSPLSLRPGDARTLTVVLDRAGQQTTALLDGQAVFQSGDELRAIDRSLLSVGKSPPGMTLGRPAFAGRMRPVP
ncbi:MAG: hypothetical protein ACHQKZ_02760 [Solirubrobacterales bacterium]